jgi:hypothetical protein
LLHNINNSSKLPSNKKCIIIRSKNLKKCKHNQLKNFYNFIFDFNRIPECELSSFQTSNILEAICLATYNYSLDYTTRSLNNSGHSVILVSAGDGFYYGEE